MLFAFGALFAVLYIGLRVDMSLLEAFRFLDDQARLVLFDFSIDPEKRYTIWAAVIGGIALNIAVAWACSLLINIDGVNLDEIAESDVNSKAAEVKASTLFICTISFGLFIDY